MKISFPVLFLLFQGLVFAVAQPPIDDVVYQLMAGMGLFGSFVCSLAFKRAMPYDRPMVMILGFVLFGGSSSLVLLPVFTGGIQLWQGIVSAVLADLAGFLIGDSLSQK